MTDLILGSLPGGLYHHMNSNVMQLLLFSNQDRHMISPLSVSNISMLTWNVTDVFPLVLEEFFLCSWKHIWGWKHCWATCSSRTVLDKQELIQDLLQTGSGEVTRREHTRGSACKTRVIFSKSKDEIDQKKNKRQRKWGGCQLLERRIKDWQRPAFILWQNRWVESSWWCHSTHQAPGGRGWLRG